MPKTMDFKAPLDLVEGVHEAVKALPTGTAPLIGNWTNCDPSTRSLVRAALTTTPKKGIVNLELFGACHPTPCDWGVVPAHVFASNVGSKDAVAFSASYKFDFKETFVTGMLIEPGLLMIELYSHFTDGSDRMDYYTKDYFHR